MERDHRENFHRSLYEHSDDAVFYTAPDGRILAANPAACRLFGYAESEMCKLGRDGLVDAGSPHLARMLEERERTGTTQGEITFVRKGGSRFTGWLSSSIFRDESGHSRTVIIVRDLTAMKEKEAALRQSIHELEDLYNHAPCGYHSLDADGRILKINQTELNWIGYRREELMGKAYRDLLTPDSQKAHQKGFERFKQTGHIKDFEFELVHKDGHRVPALLNSTAVLDDHGRFLMSRSTIVDLTVRKALEQELKKRAYTDSLTGLINRSHFSELAEKSFAGSKRLDLPLGFLILDVDHFKRINDTYGHDAGDAALMAIGECCLRTVREIDVLGRWGGEEFVALLPGSEGLAVKHAAERLRAALSSLRVDVGPGVEIAFTVSIGASWIHRTDTSIQSMFKRADMALYAAKRAGRDRVMLEEET